jgi:hypothetical protein
MHCTRPLPRILPDSQEKATQKLLMRRSFAFLASLALASNGRLMCAASDVAGEVPDCVLQEKNLGLWQHVGRREIYSSKRSAVPSYPDHWRAVYTVQ